MIDRLIELLDETFAIQYDKRGVIKAHHTAEFLSTFGVTVQEWISVKDRLPEEDGRYLAFVKGFYATFVRTLNFAKDGRKVDEFDFDEGAKNVWYRYDSEYGYVTVEDVTHWMPLPQPPKGE